MRCNCWTAVFCCLAALSAAAPATADGPSAGQIALTVAHPGGVALAIDLDALAHELCTGGQPDLRASAECGLTAGNHRSSIDLQSGAAIASKDGRVSVEVTPSTLDLAGTTLLSTPCGVWQYSLQLDPVAAQRPAPLTLHPATTHPDQGMFAGVIEVAAVLHLVRLVDADGHPDEHTAIDLPFGFTFQLAGAWATAPDPLPNPKSSDLLLFAGSAGNVWRPRPGCEWTIFGGVWCESCLKPAPSVLESLNPKPPL